MPFSQSQQFVAGWGAWSLNDFRLSVVSGNAVPTTDQTAKGTLYLTPIFNNGTITTAKGSIALCDSNGNLQVLNSAEVSLALSGLSTTIPTDVFAYNNSGTLTLELLQWASGTARATAIGFSSVGILAKSGDSTRRYVGTIQGTSTTTTEDSAACRYVWNVQHRALRTLYAADSTASWTYTSPSFREVRAQSTFGTSRVGVVIGLSQDAVELTGAAQVTQSGTASVQIGIGINSTSANSALIQTWAASSSRLSPSARLITVPAVGLNFYALLEASAASGTTTWWGSNPGPVTDSSQVEGLTGSCFA